MPLFQTFLIMHTYEKFLLQRKTSNFFVGEEYFGATLRYFKTFVRECSKKLKLEQIFHPLEMPELLENATKKIREDMTQ